MSSKFHGLMRAAGVVLTGYMSIGVLVVLTDMVVGKICPSNYVSGTTPPAFYFVVSLVAAPLYSVLGGWICARLSRKPWRDAVALVIFGEIMGVASLAMTWNSQPHWYGLALLALYPPAVLLGAWLRMRGRGTQAAAA
jgi:hypothetical protein